MSGDAVWSVAADAVVAKYELDKVRQPRRRQADVLRPVPNSFARRLRSRASALATRPCRRGPTAVSWQQPAGTARPSTRSGVRLTCQRPAVHRVGTSPVGGARLSPRQRLHRRLCAERRQPMRRGGQGRTRDRLGSRILTVHCHPVHRAQPSTCLINAQRQLNVAACTRRRSEFVPTWLSCGRVGGPNASLCAAQSHLTRRTRRSPARRPLPLARSFSTRHGLFAAEADALWRHECPVVRRERANRLDIRRGLANRSGCVHPAQDASRGIATDRRDGRPARRADSERASRGQLVVGNDRAHRLSLQIPGAGAPKHHPGRIRIVSARRGTRSRTRLRSNSGDESSRSSAP